MQHTVTSANSPKPAKMRLGRRVVRAARALFPLLKATANGWMQDNAMRLSAALSLYTILALAPLVVITAKVIGAVAAGEEGREAYALDQITAQLTALMGKQVADAVRPMIEAGAQHGGGWLATLLSTGVLVISATGVFAELQDSMNIIWGVKPKPNQSVRDFVRNRLLSLAMVLGTGFLLLMSMAMTAFLDRMAARIQADAAWLALALDPVVSLIVVTILFGAIFKFLPDVKLAWQHVALGGALTAVLFTMGKYALALYFRHAAPTSAFGAAGSLAAVMLWVYYSSFILFFGAEFTKVWSVRHLHAAVVPEENAVKVTEEDRARQGIPTDQRMHDALAGEPLTDGPIEEPETGRTAPGG